MIDLVFKTIFYAIMALSKSFFPMSLLMRCALLCRVVVPWMIGTHLFFLTSAISLES